MSLFEEQRCRSYQSILFYKSMNVVELGSAVSEAYFALFSIGARLGGLPPYDIIQLHFSSYHLKHHCVYKNLLITLALASGINKLTLAKDHRWASLCIGRHPSSVIMHLNAYYIF